MTYLLAIESSCDETAAAVIADGQLVSNIIATQQVHSLYGGVVPELASRAHQQNIWPVVAQALEKAGIYQKELSGVAYTKGPGLLGALLVGGSFAKGLALALQKPLIEVDHLEAHILAHFLEPRPPQFPFICLTVSGGHTRLTIVKSPFDMELIGQTLDDAAGEAFDKTAKMLGLAYPGGPLLDKLAQHGNPQAFAFPISKMQNFDFSFSGLKTAVLYFLQKQKPGFIQDNMADICASIQYTIIEVLMHKLIKAAKETGISRIALAGGVAANSGLRAELHKQSEIYNWQIFIPKHEFCTDNAAMIGMAGWFKYLELYSEVRQVLD